MDRLNAFVEKAVGWIDAHLDEFDPFKGGQPFEIRLGQRVGELAILLHAYLGLTGRTGDRAAARMAETLERIQCHPEFISRLIRSPLEFILFAEVYANLRAIGRDDPGVHALIQRVLDAGFLEQTERFPNRMMDIRACLDMGGFETDYPSLPDLYDRSILAGRLDPLLLSQEDLYAITHVLMFIYGFGTRDDLSVPAGSRDDLECLLSGLLVVAGQEHHWDLMAELLICWECLSLPPSQIPERAWTQLERLQDPDGAIPGPEWAARLSAQLLQPSEATANPESYFSHHYHTTLISLIAACLRGRRLEGRSPTAPSQEAHKPRERASPHAAQRLGAASAAQLWLDRLTDDVLSDTNAQASVLSQLALGHWLAAALAGDQIEKAAPEVRRIGTTIAKRDTLNELTWSHAPPAQSLLVAGLLERHGIFVPYLHSRDGFVSRVVKALQPRSESVIDDLALNEPRVVLQNLGWLSASPPLEASELVAYAEGLLLGANNAEIDALLDRVEAHTGCGTRPSQLQPREIWIAELLAGVAAYSLRRYDFARGGRLIRAVAALEPLNPSSQDLIGHCLSFICLNQRQDGAFGFLAPEARALEDAEPGYDSERTLALPVTVNCLWALAEAESGWRLFGSLGQSRRSTIRGDDPPRSRSGAKAP